MAYRWLAQYYDTFFLPFRAPFDATRREILDPLLPEVQSACDLACGTGTTAIELAQRGIRTCAVDVSPEMCRQARAKARRSGVRVRVLQGDMRWFRLPEPVDLVTCEYDAINHVPRHEDLAKVVKAVARALKPGGHFFFDVNMQGAFERYWSGTVWLEEQQVAAVMRNGRDLEARRAFCEIEWFLKRGKLWRREKERVDEVWWSAREIRAALAGAGFGRIRAWDAAPFFAGKIPMEPRCRTVYVAQRRP